MYWKQLKAVAKSLKNGASIGAACDGAKINRTTLWRWRKSNPKVDAFIVMHLDAQIQVVEDALFRRACGYRYEEETKEKEIGTTEKKTIKVVVKEVPPDSSACFFYLMNRAPGSWADKRALVNNYNVIKNSINPLGAFKDEELNGILDGILRRPEALQSR